ncbi:MAG: 50S ribosomal protein L18 [Acidobacteriota bacterium]
MLLQRRKKKEIRRASVRQRVRRRVCGTPDRPRLAVFRSHRHLHLQVIDDESGQTLASVSTQETMFHDLGFRHGATVPAAAAAGKLLAERARAKGVSRVVFDRGGYHYHGRVRAVAEAARKVGLEL